MAKNQENSGGPTYTRKDAPTPDPAKHRNAKSREELQERAASDGPPGGGRRNGSKKK